MYQKFKKENFRLIKRFFLLKIKYRKVKYMHKRYIIMISAVLIITVLFATIQYGLAAGSDGEDDGINCEQEGEHEGENEGCNTLMNGLNVLFSLPIVA